MRSSLIALELNASPGVSAGARQEGARRPGTLGGVKILVVEDDERLAAVIRRGLAESGHVVDVEYDGVAGQRAGYAVAYDVIVLDLMLPKRDGIDVARELRRLDVRTPILMLTSRDTVEDTVLGLDAGADDYLRKPFAFAELEARLRSVARRAPVAPRTELRVADVVMDLATRRVTRAGQPIDLTARDLAFLEYLMRNAGFLLSRRRIEDAVWEHDRQTASNVIEVYVRRLRGKLSPNGEPSLISTVRGAGYRFGPRITDA
jgi:DNA-binding response OmpR family regulator